MVKSRGEAKVNLQHDQLTPSVERIALVQRVWPDSCCNFLWQVWAQRDWVIQQWRDAMRSQAPCVGLHSSTQCSVYSTSHWRNTLISLALSMQLHSVCCSILYWCLHSVSHHSRCKTICMYTQANTTKTLCVFQGVSDTVSLATCWYKSETMVCVWKCVYVCNTRMQN